MSDPFLAAMNAAIGSPPPAVADPSTSLGSRAVRNNSPGNLKPGFNRDGSPRMIWAGQTGVDPQGFATFDSPDSGMAASRQQVLHDYNGGLRTPIQLATKYAPPGENNTAAYAAKLAGRLGIKPTDDAGLSNPTRLDAYMGQLYRNEDGGGASAPAGPATDPHDPFLSAMNSAIGDGDAGGSGSPSSTSVGPVPGGNDPGSGGVNGGGGVVDLAPAPGNSGGAGTGPAGTGSPQASGLTGALQGASDFGIGVARGFGHVAGTLDAGVDKLGHATGLWDSDQQDKADDYDAFLAKHQYDPNGWGAFAGSLTGDIGATLPLGEVKALELVPALRKVAEARQAAIAAGSTAGRAAGLAMGAGNAAIQGAAAGALTSGGHDTGEQALIGAAAGPIVGGAVNIGSRGFLKGVEAANNSRLAQALRDAIGTDASKAATTAEASGANTVAAPRDLPPLPEGQTIRPGSAFVDPDRPFMGQAGVDERTGAATPEGLVVDVTGGQSATSPAPPSPAPSNDNAALEDALRKAALGSRGARAGIEADTAWPASVQDDVQSLMNQGLPADQALREADARYVGAQPTLAHVTRAPSDQRALREGVKLDTPEGQQLATLTATNNQALHNTLQDTVNEYGGVPAAGEATQTAAQSLAAASDAQKAKVSDLYAQADAEAAQRQGADDLRTAWAQREANRSAAADAQQAARDNLDAAQAAYRDARNSPGSTGAANVGKARDAVAAARDALREVTENPPAAPPVPRSSANGGYINLSPVTAALNAPEMANPSTDGLRSMVSGVKGYIDQLSGGTGFVTAQQAENVRQAIGDAYSPMGGSINGHVGRLKGLVDQAMDSAQDGAGGAYRAARAAHRQWAAAYENPAGVSKLIARDAQGNFLNEDGWRKAENFGGATSDKPFAQVVRQLQANGDQGALNKLKAMVVQHAYEHATGARGGTATDLMGNSVVSGSKFLARLNEIGRPKLDALFTPEEQSHLATIGRAASALNEAIPGAENTSNTAATRINDAMKRQAAAKGGGDKTAAHFVVGAVGQFAGHAVAPGPVGSLIGASVNGAKGVIDKTTAAVGKGRATRDLAAGLKEFMSPEMARAADKARTVRLAAELRRRHVAGAISERTPSAVAGGHRRRR